MAKARHWEESGVYWKFNDTVTGEEVISSNMSFYGDPIFDKMHYIIADFLDADQFDITEEQVEEIAALDRAAAMSNPRMKVAIVASEKHIQQLAALYVDSSQGSQWKSKIFDNLEDARQWVLS